MSAVTARSGESQTPCGAYQEKGETEKGTGKRCLAVFLVIMVSVLCWGLTEPDGLRNLFFQ